MFMCKCVRAWVSECIYMSSAPTQTHSLGPKPAVLPGPFSGPAWQFLPVLRLASAHPVSSAYCLQPQAQPLSTPSWEQ